MATPTAYDAPAFGLKTSHLRPTGEAHTICLITDTATSNIRAENTRSRGIRSRKRSTSARNPYRLPVGVVIRIRPEDASACYGFYPFSRR